MKCLHYLDSYNYYGLWDESFRIFNEKGDSDYLHNKAPYIELTNTVSTRDALKLLIVNAKKLKKEYIAYTVIERDFDKNKTTIEITYCFKEFEKIIPQIIKKEKENMKKNEKVKLTFIYEPIDEKDFFMNKEQTINALKDYVDEEVINEFLKDLVA